MDATSVGPSGASESRSSGTVALPSQQKQQARQNAQGGLSSLAGEATSPSGDGGPTKFIHTNSPPQPDGQDFQTGLEERAKRNAKSLLRHHLGESRYTAACDLPLVKKMLRGQRCMSWLLCGQFLEGPALGQKRVKRTNACCNYLTCESCAHVRSSKLAASIEATLTSVFKKRPELVPLLVTLTIPTGPDLKRQVELMHGLVSGLLRRRREPKRYHWSMMRDVAGGTRSFETTPGKGQPGFYHHHVHMIVLVDRASLQREGGVEAWGLRLRVEWQNMVVAEGLECSLKGQDVRLMEATISAILEAVKYSVKFSEFTDAHILDVYDVLRKSSKGGGTLRSFDTFGVMRGVEIEPDLEVEDNGLDWKKYAHELFNMTLTSRGYEEVGPREFVASEVPFDFSFEGVSDACTDDTSGNQRRSPVVEVGATSQSPDRNEEPHRVEEEKIQREDSCGEAGNRRDQTGHSESAPAEVQRADGHSPRRRWSPVVGDAVQSLSLRERSSISHGLLAESGYCRGVGGENGSYRESPESAIGSYRGQFRALRAHSEQGRKFELGPACRLDRSAEWWEEIAGGYYGQGY
jgi:hypothetical protein